jgi:hypothetical protein
MNKTQKYDPVMEELIQRDIADPNYKNKHPTSIGKYCPGYSEWRQAVEIAFLTIPLKKKKPEKKPAQIRQVRLANGSLGYTCEQGGEQRPGCRQVRMPNGDVEYIIDSENNPIQ